MVAKISHGASLYGAVTYNQKKVNEGTARIIGGNRMLSDMTGNPDNIMQQTLVSFESYLVANRNTRKPVLHISLNPAMSDRTTALSIRQLTIMVKRSATRLNLPFSENPLVTKD
jgi:hypothetical protein